MTKIIVGFLMIASLLGCSKPEPEDVRLRLEVGHPMLGDLTGLKRLWAIYRFQSLEASGLEPGDAITAFLTCSSSGAPCVVDRVEKRLRARPIDRHLWINGRVVQAAHDGRELALLLEPFPIEWKGSQEQLKFTQGKTKLIEASYALQNGKLEFEQVNVVGVENRSPAVWK